MSTNEELKVIDNIDDVPEDVLLELSDGRGDDEEGEVG